MNFTKNTVLKENYTFFVGDEQGRVGGGERGLYSRDTRFLSRYAWNFGEGTSTLLAHSPRPDNIELHFARIEDLAQRVGITRRVSIASGGLTDELRVQNTSLEPQTLTLSLTFAADFADLFEARGWFEVDPRDISREVADGTVRFSYLAPDAKTFTTKLAFSTEPDTLSEAGAEWQLELAPGQVFDVNVHVHISDEFAKGSEAIRYETWRGQFAAAAPLAPDVRVFAQAVDDLRALLLFTEHGPVPAAGIPWYVAAFGRDSLLTALMTLPYAPEVAAGTLRFLAAHQGEREDAFRVEAPGKIMHEVRYGELSRLDEIPFGRYYGTVDATALWVMLLHATWRLTGDDALVNALRPSLDAALTWLTTHGDPDGDGFLEFEIGAASDGEGLVIQSWKDSVDSMSHEDGTLATGPLAVSEVQGYAYAAYRAAADLYSHWQEGEQAEQWQARADKLKSAFHEAFWLEDLQTYAMALDGDKRPLRVQNSGVGHLLWTRIVPEGVAPGLVKTLFSETNWSGWGVRTLGQREVRYNPLSYHNGSVWPHDTALAAAGLAAYGFSEEARLIRTSLYELASSQTDRRLPELIAGYPRTDAPPVPYPEACRPQAWDAAALLFLLDL